MAVVAVLVSNPCTGDARVIKIAHAARDAGHKVHIFARADNVALPFEVLDGITYHRLVWNVREHMLSGLLGRILSRIHRKLGRVYVKLLTPYVKYGVFGDVFHEKVIAVNPSIIHAHDLICLPAAFRAAAANGARVIYDAHELEVHRHPPLPFLERQNVRYVERKYGRRADAVITVGKMVRDELARELGRQDIHTIYNSPEIEPSDHNIRRDLQVPDDQQVLLYVGKVTVGRGVEYVIDLLPRLPNVVFATVGPCSEALRAELQKQAETVNVSSRFRILPPVPYKQVVSYISGANAGIIAADVVALSYRYSMPNKLLEMAFANVPVIASDLTEIGHFLQEFNLGKTVDFERREAMLYEVAKFVATSHQYRMTAQAYAKMSEEYSWTTQRLRVRQIYESLLAAPAQN